LSNSFKINRDAGLADKLLRLHMQNESPGSPLDLNHDRRSSHTVQLVRKCF
jgi:hypothetical protein